MPSTAGPQIHQSWGHRHLPLQVLFSGVSQVPLWLLLGNSISKHSLLSTVALWSGRGTGGEHEDGKRHLSESDGTSLPEVVLWFWGFVESLFSTRESSGMAGKSVIWIPSGPSPSPEQGNLSWLFTGHTLPMEAVATSGWAEGMQC